MIQPGCFPSTAQFTCCEWLSLPQPEVNKSIIIHAKNHASRKDEDKGSAPKRGKTETKATEEASITERTHNHCPKESQAGRSGKMETGLESSAACKHRGEGCVSRHKLRSHVTQTTQGLDFFRVQGQIQ
ncbi:uncharacterized protein [Littorina saxatilis]|uniref:uncharacterized protein isoform X1 n=1 Tax=Littorina saxatilis TaxID=31220 RepID=UPI0038B6A554